MPKDNEDTSIWFEVLQRLTKIETNTEGLNEISGTAMFTGSTSYFTTDPLP